MMKAVGVAAEIIAALRTNRVSAGTEAGDITVLCAASFRLPSCGRYSSLEGAVHLKSGLPSCSFNGMYVVVINILNHAAIVL